HCGAHRPRPDCVRPELRVLHAGCQRLFAQHPRQLLTPPATHTGESSMSRERNVVAGAVMMFTIAALAACNPTKDLVVPKPPVDPLFASYVSLGNSITAGFQSGGINDSTQHQAYPVLLAAQMNTPFTIPSLLDPGCP